MGEAAESDVGCYADAVDDDGIDAQGGSTVCDGDLPVLQLFLERLEEAMGNAEGKDGQDGKKGMAGESQKDAGYGGNGKQKGGGARAAYFFCNAVGEDAA